MNKILACIDTLGHTDAVIDWAAWAAVRLDRPLEFLHVLERHPEHAEVTDFSGTIGVDAQDSLLQELSDQDALRSRALREAGRRLLAHARSRAAEAGAHRLDARLRHGDFVETAIELQAEAELYVLGEHHHDAARGRLQHEHRLEQVIRGVASPVLVATVDAFATPQRAVIAFDGSAPALKALPRLAAHPLLAGLPVSVAMAAPDTPAAQRQLDQARSLLEAAGVAADTARIDGEAPKALRQLVQARSPALLVMGAPGHSLWRQWMMGSTTSTVLRTSEVPVLILR